MTKLAIERLEAAIKLSSPNDRGAKVRRAVLAILRQSSDVASQKAAAKIEKDGVRATLDLEPAAGVPKRVSGLPVPDAPAKPAGPAKVVSPVPTENPVTGARLAKCLKCGRFAIGNHSCGGGK